MNLSLKYEKIYVVRFSAHISIKIQTIILHVTSHFHLLDFPENFERCPDVTPRELDTNRR